MTGMDNPLTATLSRSQKVPDRKETVTMRIKKESKAQLGMIVQSDSKKVFSLILYYFSLLILFFCL